MEYITEMQSISKVEVWELYQYAGKVVKISGITRVLQMFRVENPYEPDY